MVKACDNIIKFNKKLYPDKCILSSIVAFKHLGQFHVKNEGDYIIVTLNRVNPAVKNIIKDEFSNYVLAKIKSR